jgi:hypothetical protein
MALPLGLGGQSLVPRRAPRGELLQEMAPFMLELSVRDEDPGSEACASELAPVERISARGGFGVDRLQIRTDGGKRRCLGRESSELWMIAIPAGGPAQHGTSQQGFAPERDQALRIEVFGVQ